MDRLFPEWYRAVHLEPDVEKLNKRWLAIEKYGKAVDYGSIINLVKLFYGKSLIDDSFLKKFNDIFRSTDPVFPIRNNEIEIRVLAGSTLMCLLSDKSSKADAAAYSIVCANYSNSKPTNILIPEIIENANKYLVERSLNIRKNIPSNKMDVAPNIKINIAQPANNIAQIAPQLEGQICDSITKFAQTLNAQLADYIKKETDILREEIDILWWVLGEYSNDLECPISDIPFASRGTIVAMELADKTILLPAPISARAFLSKILSVSNPKKDKYVTLKDSINASPRDWRTKRSNGINIQDKAELCPILFAIKKSLEVGDGDEWVPIFTNATGINANVEVKPIDISYQLYQENLLIRIIENL